MYVAKGKRIYLFMNGTSYLEQSSMPQAYVSAGYRKEIPLYLGEDLNIKTSSEYGAPFASMQEGAVALSNFIQVVGAAGTAAGVSALSGLANKTVQNKFSSYQFWKYSNPITFSFVVNLFPGIADIYDAKQEVYLPTLRLQELVLPTESGKGTTLLGKVIGQGLIPPGPTMSTFLSESGLTKSNSSDSHFSMVIGNILELESCIIKSVEATFSKEVDENGYPIKSTIRLDVSSTTVATTNMLRNSIRPEDKRILARKEKDQITSDLKATAERHALDMLYKGL